jgi:hypothetical protein
MSMSQYLWAVARALQTQVLPSTTSGLAKDSLQHSINVITVIANAIEPKAPDSIARPPVAAQLPLADTDRLSGPAENSGAYIDVAAALASGAQSFDQAKDSAYFNRTDTRALIQWEKALLDHAVGKMDAITNAKAVSQDDPRLQIDPNALQTFLRQALQAPKLQVTDFRQALGGRSRQTGLFRIAQAPAGFASDLVVQRMIPGLDAGPSFATVKAQYEIFKRMNSAGMKVPKPVCFDTGNTGLGSPFLVVEKSRGKVVEPDYWLAPNSPAVALQLAEQMARLHAEPIGDLGPIIRTQ